MFHNEKKPRISGNAILKEPMPNKEKTVLNFIKSPNHKTPNKRKSMISPTFHNEDFSSRTKLLTLQSTMQSPGSERLFEDLFVIGLDKKELKPGLQQLVSPKIIHTQGFSQQTAENEWFI